MITIIQKRGTGKAKEMLKAADKVKNSVIVTQDKRAFSVKAHNYGYGHIPIYDYEDLENDQIPIDSQLFIHNGDKVLYWLLNKYYGFDVVGFTATVED